MSRTIKGGYSASNGSREYWTKRPHNKLGAQLASKYAKQRTARTERRLGKKETQNGKEESI